MKTKIRLMLLPLLGVASVVLAQDAGQGGAAAQDEAVAVQESVQTQEQASERKLKRQGKDMRNCLKLESNEAIIRCAEPGRKP